MTPEICLISVPHNGTLFTLDVFRRHGWKEASLNELPPKHVPTVYQGHCTKLGQTMMALELGRRMPIVMPLRHPYRVEESWRRRGYPPDQVLTDLVFAYRHMFTQLADRAIFLPLDANPLTRAKQHDELNAAAGVELAIDWDNIVGGKNNTHAIKLSALDPSPQIREIRANPLFVEFYEEDEPNGNDIN